MMTLALESETLDSLLRRVAEGVPAPGGGAAAALAGATAAALVGMVARITRCRSGDDPRLAAAEARADERRKRLIRLMTLDCQAYENVLDARRLPRVARAETLPVALRRATAVPAEVASASLELLELCEAIAPSARASAMGDLGVATALAWAALESGAQTARINLKALADADFVSACGRELQRVTDEGGRARRRIMDAIAERA